MSEALERMVAAQRGFTVAAAGCGKTELIARLVGDPRMGRQLVLTHTHAGVSALQRRLRDARVPASKYHLETIAGWCLRLGSAYPRISGLKPDAEGDPAWPSVYPGASKVVGSSLGMAVLRASYDGVLVDEYQDCVGAQHELIEAVARVLPCRAVGDPLQSIFGFREPCVTWSAIRQSFDVLPPLEYPWRWRRPGRNPGLGDWLTAARGELKAERTLTLLANSAPIWKQAADHATTAEICRKAAVRGETTIVIAKWPRDCIALSRRLGGRWPVIEAFDERELPVLASRMGMGNGPDVVVGLHEFLSERMTGIGPGLRAIVEAIGQQRPTNRFRKELEYLRLLEGIAKRPTPERILAFIAAVLADRRWWLYRRENVFQLRSALMECEGGRLEQLPEAVSETRARARRRGRLLSNRSIGTTLLVKGLEFDHAVVVGANALSAEELYVAITRASKSLTVISQSRRIATSDSRS